MVTAVIVMGIMISIGLATFAYVGGQQAQSRVERVKESAFNLSEGALNTQAFITGERFPGSFAGRYPASCPAADNRCPNAASLTNSFDNRDFAAGLTWSTRVRDNSLANPNYYTPALDTQNCQGSGTTPCTWDANGDGKVWIRSDATVRGKTRRLVTLVVTERSPEQFPRNVITAQRLDFHGSPRQGVNTRGAPVAVRCFPRSNKDCADNRGEVEPDTIQDSWPSQTAMTVEAVERLRQRAKDEGGYYTGCPAGRPPTALVFIEDCATTSANHLPCPLGTGAGCTSPTALGTFVLIRGTFAAAAAWDYHGLLYLRNEQNSCGDVFDITGNHQIYGAVAIDGCGGLSLGTSSQTLFTYNPDVWGQLYTYGNGRADRSSFREL